MTDVPSTGDAAIQMAKAAALHQPYPEALGHTPEFDALWDEVSGEVAAIEAAGQVVDIPFDQSSDNPLEQPGKPPSSG